MEKRPVTLFNNMTGSSDTLSIVIGKFTLKIPTFDGTGPRKLYHKQSEATAAHNQCTNMEKEVALIVPPKGAAQQVLGALL